MREIHRHSVVFYEPGIIIVSQDGDGSYRLCRVQPGHSDHLPEVVISGFSGPLLVHILDGLELNVFRSTATLGEWVGVTDLYPAPRGALVTMHPTVEDGEGGQIDYRCGFDLHMPSGHTYRVTDLSGVRRVKLEARKLPVMED